METAKKLDGNATRVSTQIDVAKPLSSTSKVPTQILRYGDTEEYKREQAESVRHHESSAKSSIEMRNFAGGFSVFMLGFAGYVAIVGTIGAALGCASVAIIGGILAINAAIDAGDHRISADVARESLERRTTA